MLRSSQSQKLQAVELLRSGNSTRKVANVMRMNQLWVAHLKRKIAKELEMQRGGCLRILTRRERRRCVTLLTEGYLGVASKTTREIQKN